MVPYNQQLDKEKLEASDLVAGQNVTLEKNGNTITINSENTALLIQQDYNFTKKKAGEAGYFSVSVTIPSGYKIASFSASTGQIANSNGLQITPIYGYDLKGGKVEQLYFNYYAPKTQALDVSLIIYILCIKI